ncbi:uncharacterized protein G2W53_039412 [Senna tora]|uniref:Uncharacterized protein n=1 Tax=Senna tora TaxID=362788 RepID=A0A834SPY1_9FABA|nr:uncharacterized protein G2W53_039412 [Senna tora]
MEEQTRRRSRGNTKVESQGRRNKVKRLFAEKRGPKYEEGMKQKDKKNPWSKKLLLPADDAWNSLATTVATMGEYYNNRKFKWRKFRSLSCSGLNLQKAPQNPKPQQITYPHAESSMDL